MLQRAFHLILVLCLALNGLAAPSAIAAHAHASAVIGAGTEGDDAAPCGMHAATQEAVPAVQAQTPLETPVAMNEDCCGSDDCRCGCMLSPLLLLPTTASTSTAVADAQFRIAAIEPARHRHAPPLRPPAR